MLQHLRKFNLLHHWFISKPFFDMFNLMKSEKRPVKIKMHDKVKWQKKKPVDSLNLRVHGNKNQTHDCTIYFGLAFSLDFLSIYEFLMPITGNRVGSAAIRLSEWPCCRPKKSHQSIDLLMRLLLLLFHHYWCHFFCFCQWNKYSSRSESKINQEFLSHTHTLKKNHCWLFYWKKVIFRQIPSFHRKIVYESFP